MYCYNLLKLKEKIMCDNDRKMKRSKSMDCTIPNLFDYSAGASKSESETSDIEYSSDYSEEEEIYPFFTPLNTIEEIISKYNPDDVRKYGGEYLCLAIEYGRTDVAELLLNKGVDVNYINNDGKSLISYAVICGQIKSVLLLIENGADINAKDNLNKTPLDYANDYRRTKIAELLRKNKAETMKKAEKSFEEFFDNWIKK